MDAAEAAEAADEEAEPRSGAPMPIRDAVLRDILTSGMTHGSKLTPAAVSLSSVLLHAFVREAWHRAAEEAAEAGDEAITEEHLEKILPALLLDMGP